MDFFCNLTKCSSYKLVRKVGELELVWSVSLEAIKLPGYGYIYNCRSIICLILLTALQQGQRHILDMISVSHVHIISQYRDTSPHTLHVYVLYKETCTPRRDLHKCREKLQTPMHRNRSHIPKDARPQDHLLRN